jgi:hypothetical protein
MSDKKFSELCEYLNERNPGCFHYVIAVREDLDEAFLDVINRVYESPEKAREEAKEVLLKIVVRMIEDEKENPVEYLMNIISRLTDKDQSCVCTEEGCTCKTKLICEEHPKYQAMRKPRSGCEKCWEIYKEKHPDATTD